jgi:hypothetical protein
MVQQLFAHPEQTQAMQQDTINDFHRFTDATNAMDNTAPTITCNQAGPLKSKGPRYDEHATMASTSVKVSAHDKFKVVGGCTPVVAAATQERH